MPTALKIIIGLWLVVIGLTLTTPALAQEGKDCKSEDDPTFNHRTDDCPVSLDQYCQDGQTKQATGGVCNLTTKRCQYNYNIVPFNPLRCEGDTAYVIPRVQTCDPSADEDICKAGTAQYCSKDKTMQCKSGSCSSDKKVCDYKDCQEVSGNPLGCKGGVQTVTASSGSDKNAQLQTQELVPLTKDTKDKYGSAQNTDNMINNLLGHTLPCLGEGHSLDGTPCFVNLVAFSPSGALKSLPYLADAIPGGGAVGLTQGVILALSTTPPLQASEYLADLGRNFGVTPAYAQVGGSGSNVLSPILEIWRLMRNLAYLFMIIIFLVIGIMIMLRRRINPQTIVSIQTALPGLVIGLILITFSYFLASLLVDLAFVAAQVAGRILELANIIGPAGTRTQQILQQQNLITIFSAFINLRRVFDTAGTIANLFTFLNQGLVSHIVTTISSLLGCQLGGNIGNRLTQAFGTLVNGIGVIGGCVAGQQVAVRNQGFIIGMILYGVLLIALIFAMFRLLFTLIGNYISIIVLTITAPFTFLIASLPGRQGGIGTWIRAMLCNVLAFPATLLVFFFAAYLLGPNSIPELGVINGAAPFHPLGALPLFGGFPQDLIRLALAYGILLASPSLPGIICTALNVDPRTGQAINKTIKENVGYGASFGTRGAVTTWRRGGAALAPIRGWVARIRRPEATPTI